MSKFTNSPLVTYTKLSPNCTVPRKSKIDTITIHVMAGNISIETCGNIFASSARQASSNYGIGSDGRIALYCDEANRSWCSSNADNDHRAVTIEVANSVAKEPWPISDSAMESLINLCADICKRNDIKKLLWKADKSLIGQIDKQNMTVHRWFARKSCLPIDTTELLTPTGWKKLEDLKVGEDVACAHIEDLTITFGPIRDIIQVREQEVYNIRDVEATSDHRMIYHNDQGEQYIGDFSNLLNETWTRYIPNAGFYKGKGLPLTDDEIELLVAIQATGNELLNGIEFHLKEECKIDKILCILDFLGYSSNINRNNDNSLLIQSYDKKLLDFCKSNLENKMFPWKFIELNPNQAKVFLSTLPFWNGSVENNSYYSALKQNRDVVSAVASLNGVGSLINEHSVLSLKPSTRSIDVGTAYQKYEKKVSCVTVDSGFILIRQHHRTTIVGNCPGDYVYDKLSYIASEVNKKLESDAIPTTVDSNSIDATIWEFFKNKKLHDIAIAGIMGNLYAESGLRSNNLQNTFEAKLIMTDDSYTKAVDMGTYKDFVNDKAGYGLAQWTFWSRKRDLYKFAKESGTSIGDLNMQLNFLWNELQTSYPKVLIALKAATSVKEASDTVLLDFERPADSSSNVQEQRAKYAMSYYNKFAIPIKEVPKVEEVNLAKQEYRVSIIKEANYREGPGLSYKVLGTIRDRGIYTISENSKDGKWGKLKSGAGWVSLALTKKI